MERMVRLKIDCLALTRFDALHLLNRLLTNMAEDPNHDDNNARGGWTIGATYGSVTADMAEVPNAGAVPRRGSDVGTSHLLGKEDLT